MNNSIFFHHRILFFLFFIIFFIFSCQKKETWQKTPNGLSYCILKKSKLGKQIKPGDVVEFSTQYFTAKDSLLFDSDDISLHFRMKIDSATQNQKPSFEDALLLLGTGDSAVFYLNGVDFYQNSKKESVPDFIRADDSLKFVVKVKKIMTRAEIAAEEKMAAEKSAERETDLRNQYLSRESITEKPTKSGLIIITLKKGKGRKIKVGETAQVAYLGSFISGKVFDSSPDNQPVEFVLGNPEIIPAWNQAVATMSAGDKIQVITPSSQAYGKFGLDNIIPPYSTLIYVLELKSIKGGF